MKDVVLETIDNSEGIIVIGPSEEDAGINIEESLKVIRFDLKNLANVDKYFREKLYLTLEEQ